jgi:hypothetical protein
MQSLQRHSGRSGRSLPVDTFKCQEPSLPRLNRADGVSFCVPECPGTSQNSHSPRTVDNSRPILPC